MTKGPEEFFNEHGEQFGDASASSHATAYHIKGMDELPDPLKSARNYWVKGLLNPGELSVWYGQPGAGKSFILLYLSYHIAMGLAVLGRRVKKTVVLYVTLEAATGFERRLAAMMDAFGKAAGFKWITQSINLHSAEADVEGLIAAANKCGAGIICIDTLARAFGSGNENESSDMGRVLAAVDRIRIATGAHMALVHHSGKTEDRGPRGHSSLKAAADLVVEVKRQNLTRTASVEKSRDGVDGDQFVFELKGVELGTDEDGDAVATCIAVPSSEPAEARKHKPTGQSKTAFDLLVRAINKEGHPAPAGTHYPVDRHVVPVSQWRRYCYEGIGVNWDKPDNQRKAFNRAFIKLQNLGRIGTWGDFVWVL